MEEKRVLSLSGGTRPGIVLVVTRNNLNSIIYRPRMFGRDPEDEIKASWIEGVLSEPVVMVNGSRDHHLLFPN